MIEYTIKVDLLTDTLLGSGQSVPGIIDTDVKYDETHLKPVNLTITSTNGAWFGSQL